MGRGRGRGLAQTKPAWMTNPQAQPATPAAESAEAKPKPAPVEVPEDTGGWVAVPDPENPSEHYYWNSKSGETTWERPAEMGPAKGDKGEEAEATNGAEDDSAAPAEATGKQKEEAEAEITEGQVVEYDDRAAGRKVLVRVVHVERAVAAGESPFFTVELPNGAGERQTERTRLRVVANPAAAAAAAPAAAVPPAANPRVFFDLNIGGMYAGRVTFELFANVVPRTAENFRCLWCAHHRPP